ncbi:MAG: TIGR04076 family protein [Candidatus Aminicenantes bacterium]|nr:TIGR04076 family protein [Candidatus Aminicenantes bacterium]NIM81112.1 TIGR04076 family protein [Candidatus Aminicenantes bacterium]NIN20486.1 TIGR04076 family protein [Candidatus Aminicenantes bacterium]NIN44259.1 TIGR04076 family protein [Candidatus Aminicenantes bacterium]NIN87078.1 TIGR04076 family protein [Candidatus Aminicenantes bacterium]
MDLLVRVIEIKGHCPVYEIGDSFRLEKGYRLICDKPICMHSLASLLPHYNALLISKPEQWGLAGKSDQSKAYIQCLDPAAYTGGGTTIFEITRMGDSG